MRHLVAILKFAVPLAIIAVLVARMDRQQVLDLLHCQKNWPMLSAGFGLILTAVCLTFVRWYWLVRAIDLPFRLADAFRLGFLGYLLNFAGVGSVGADLLKAVAIARKQPGRRTEAAATVFLDRVVGLYGLLVLASTVILFIDLSKAPPVVKAICNTTALVTAVATAILLSSLVPRFRSGRLFQRLTQLPKVGPMLERLVATAGVYRKKWGVVVSAIVLSIGVHAMLSVALYLAGAALFAQPPTLSEHFVIVPLANVAGSLPFTPAGLGTFELAMERLYAWLPVTPLADGIVVAIVFRLMTIVVAMIGAVYYAISRREIGTLLDKAQTEEREERTVSAAA